MTRDERAATLAILNLKVTDILAPAVNPNAPYAKVMIDMICEAALAIIRAQAFEEAAKVADAEAVERRTHADIAHEVGQGDMVRRELSRGRTARVIAAAIRAME